MSPLNGTVLLAAAVVASPALYGGFVGGTMPTDTALTRYLVAVGACWVLFSVMVELVLPSRDEVARAVQARDAAAAAERAASADAAPPAYDVPPGSGASDPAA
ncbi:hypothetical protein [Nocardioides perillae]|uniref:Uncharacterized protein n=1 Tax=Nocardioides perillae TaxID=1119534 RepID=A0A7Y9RZN0_9ACTN|nr:hypothetical protein [Nocardioides perillae]NYG57054.1 hypothetical protein [Nocardioides perillae]